MPNQDKPTIVVGIDYSDTSVLALKRALALARGGMVHVVHAIETLVASPLAGPMAPVRVPLDEGVAALAKYVEEQLNVLRAGSTEPAPLVVSHLVLGPPAEELVQLASDLQADVIVVGTHGRRGIVRFLIGSTAERVVRLATCAVLVERPNVSTAEAAGPRIEPPCPRCVETRRSTGNAELWCSQHRERHGRRHTYHAVESGSAFPSAHGGMSSIS